MFIEIKNAKKSYGKGEAQVNAMDGIDLSLEKGKIYTILGPSGSGKSTLLNMLGGLDDIDSGTITVDGTELTKLSKKQMCDYRRKSVGFVFQFYNLIPDLTVRENVQSVKDISDDPFDIDEMLESLGIKDYAGRFPRELSGGQQQRVAIARALVKNPKILLCDELTGALDSKSSRMVLEFLEKIHAKYGTTIIIVTHNEAISKMTDVVIRVQDGNIKSVTENKERVSPKDIVF
jgi:putative ABC transport system ATP-binding protein